MGFDGATVMILVLLLLAVVLVLVFLRYVPLGLWVRALSSGVKVKVSALIGMRLRRISPHRLVDTLTLSVDENGRAVVTGTSLETTATLSPEPSVPLTLTLTEVSAVNVRVNVAE